VDVTFYLLVAAPVTATLFAAVFARMLADRLEPRLGTWLLTAMAVALAGCSTIVLGLLALGGAMRVPLVDWLGRLSLAVLRRGDPVPAPVAIAATLVLTVLAVCVIQAARMHGRALAMAYQQARRLRTEAEVVVVDDPAVDAVALPALGRLPGHVIVSTGMLDILNDDEQQVLLAHEQAHLTGHHYLFLLTSRLAAAANPLLRPVADSVAYTVERWADERAAAHSGHRGNRRRLAACAIGKAALARHRSHPPAAVQWALHAAAGPVPRRVAALLTPPQRTRRWIALTVAIMLAVSCLATLAATEQLHELLKTARFPHH
jgi:beta-lactamase regulating signal transducer with metallopeptidase domain